MPNDSTPSTHRLPLHGGAFTLIDLEDLPRCSEFKWYLTAAGYAYRRTKKSEGQPRALVLLARFLMDAQPGEVVDHLNGDPLDNRRSNLRVGTHAENMQNRHGAHSNSWTGIRGVYRHKRRYRAQLNVNGKRYRLGCFRTIAAAEAALIELRAELTPHAKY